MSGNQLHEHAIRLATVDCASALEVARRIDEPWFCSQILAWVARYAPDDRVESVAAESFSAGRKAKDDYRIVASAAWPFRALVEREKTNCIDSIIGQYLERSSFIMNLGSRCEALFLIFQAVFPAGRRHWLGVLEALNRAATPPLHWRQSRNLREAILIVGREDPQFAVEFCRTVSNSKTRRQAESRLATSEFRTPREFFWR